MFPCVACGMQRRGVEVVAPSLREEADPHRWYVTLDDVAKSARRGNRGFFLMNSGDLYEVLGEAGSDAGIKYVLKKTLSIAQLRAFRELLV